MTHHFRYGNAIALLGIFLVSACSSGGPNLYNQVGEFALSTLTGVEQQEGVELSRAELNKIPYATISVSVAGGPRAYLVPLADNDGYLDYRDEAGNSVRMLGGAVSGLQAPGYDLDAVRHGSDDPIAHRRPLADWPSEVWREYQFSLRDVESYDISLNCVFQPVVREPIEIAEISYDLMRVSEICSNARRTVINRYWIDETTGFVWKSEQWAGPKLGKIVVEVIRPYIGDSIS